MTTANFTFSISSAPSASVTVTPTAGLVAPVPVGAVLATLSIGPVGWIGGVAVDNPLLGVGGTSPNYTIVAASPLGAGNYSATVTVTP